MFDLVVHQRLENYLIRKVHYQTIFSKRSSGERETLPYSQRVILRVNYPTISNYTMGVHLLLFGLSRDRNVEM